MASEDITFRYSKDAKSAEVIVMGVSEDNLEAQIGILKRVYAIDVWVGPPQVSYRETLARPVDIDYTHKKQTGGTGEFARVKLRLQPNAPGAGNEFENQVAGVVPAEYIPGVEKGVQSVWDSGVLIGYPMIDTKVTLFDGAYHDEDSSAATFEIASRIAMREGTIKVGVKLLEPIMYVEVVSPGDFVGSIIGDINGRRGRILRQEMRGDATVIAFEAPLATLLGYQRDLRSITNGLASHSMRFSHFAEASPRNDPDNFPPAVGMRA
jgi:elongation factor G